MKYYPPQNEELKQTPHIVAVLDFLGAAEKMKTTGRSDDFLKTMQRIYDGMMNFVRWNNSSCFGETKTNEVKIQIYSDNVVLAKECQNEIPIAECQEIFTLCAFFQMVALMEGIPIRGAITRGKFCKSELFVYGEALVNAHEMEAHMAIYPRIIVDKDIIKRSYALAMLNVWGRMQKLVKQDFDGEWFINFLLPKSQSGNNEVAIDGLKKIRQGIIDTFESADLKPAVIQKYCWLSKKFNEFCEENNCNDQKLFLNGNGELVSSKFYDKNEGMML